MELNDILLLLGGLALFLYGMQMMGNGLETAAGNKMKSILEKLTSNRIKGVLVGAAITAVIQSSSATTVMVVGFVNSGLMTLNQAVWVIMGANIGTTITGQLIALDIDVIAPLFAFAGVAVIMFAKNEKIKHISEIFAGLGVLFIGMGMMGDAMAPLQQSETFISFMSNFNNPLVGILIGAVFTAIIQSSSASVGILQALASTGAIPLSSAVFILFGQNIGTCITAVLASIGTKVNAKRTTVIHLMFNIIGTILFSVICLITPFTDWIAALTPDNPVAQIANVHTTFNIVTTLVLLPFGTLMAKAAKVLLPDKEGQEEDVKRLKYIRPFENNHTVGHAAMVISQIENEVERMLQMVKKNTEGCFRAVIKNDQNMVADLEDREQYIDYLNKEISKYIVHLMTTEMTIQDSQKLNAYYRIIGDLERIGDHAINFVDYLHNMSEWDIKFSQSAIESLEQMKDLCTETLEGISKENMNGRKHVLEIAAKNEQRIDDMQESLLKGQIERMQSGKCSAEAGVILSEMLTDFERIGDHALNIAEKYEEMQM